MTFDKLIEKVQSSKYGDDTPWEDMSDCFADEVYDDFLECMDDIPRKQAAAIVNIGYANESHLSPILVTNFIKEIYETVVQPFTDEGIIN